MVEITDEQLEKAKELAQAHGITANIDRNSKVITLQKGPVSVTGQLLEHGFVVEGKSPVVPSVKHVFTVENGKATSDVFLNGVKVHHQDYPQQVHDLLVKPGGGLLDIIACVFVATLIIFLIGLISMLNILAGPGAFLFGLFLIIGAPLWALILCVFLHSL